MSEFFDQRIASDEASQSLIESLGQLHTFNQYADAYREVFSDDEARYTALEQGYNETHEFQNDVKAAGKVPAGMLRAIADSPLQGRMVKASAVVSGRQGRDLDAVQNTLNNTMVQLSPHEAQLERAYKGSDQWYKMMPEGSNPAAWPNLALVCNSNLGTPQSFYDEMIAVRDVLGKAMDGTDYTVVGSFYSRGPAPQNAELSLDRANELKRGGQSNKHVSLASYNQLSVLHDLLQARDENDRPMIKDGRKIMRADAAEVLQHVVMAGYSGGFLAASDALRLLKQEICDEQWAQIEHGRGCRSFHTLGQESASLLFENTLAFGIAGLDVATRREPWQRINLVSEHDASLAVAGGKRLINDEGTIVMQNADRKSVRQETSYSGHGLKGYYDALMADDSPTMAKVQKALGTGTGRGF